MSPVELRERLRTVIPFPVTPFNDDYSLDLDGLRRNVDFLAREALRRCWQQAAPVNFSR